MTLEDRQQAQLIAELEKRTVPVELTRALNTLEAAKSDELHESQTFKAQRDALNKWNSRKNPEGVDYTMGVKR